FVETLPINLSASTNKLQTLLYLVVPVLIVVVFAIWFIKRNERVMNFIRKTWYGFREGLLSVFRLENKVQFIIYSLAIWMLYFLMSYTVLKAFPSTSELGFGAVLSLFAIGSIAMAVPLPGGTGSYHLLVPQGLVFLYHVNSADATAFTFIFHGWQTAIMILAGAISLLLTSYQVKREALIREEQ
ncbi:lysylphosphatidylglycerol synthase domain-containing protein, partial [Dawidia soli]